MNFPCLGVDFSEILLVWVFALRFCLLGFELPVLGVFGILRFGRFWSLSVVGVFLDGVRQFFWNFGVSCLIFFAEGLSLLVW